VLSVTPRALEEKTRIDQVWVEAIGTFLDSLPEGERHAALAAATPLHRLATLGTGPDPDLAGNSRGRRVG